MFSRILHFIATTFPEFIKILSILSRICQNFPPAAGFPEFSNIYDFPNSFPNLEGVGGNIPLIVWYALRMGNCQHPAIFFDPESLDHPLSSILSQCQPFLAKSWQKLVQKLYHLNFWARDEVFSDTLWVPYFQDRLDTVWIIDNSYLFGNLFLFSENLDFILS